MYKEEEINYKEDYKILQAQVLQFFNILRENREHYWSEEYKKHFNITVVKKGSIHEN